MKKHMLIHPSIASDLKTKCDVCSKSFYKYDLARHKKVHTGERAHSCHLCLTKFITKEELRRHMKIHSAARETFKCKECPVVLLEKYGLKLHEAKHKPEYKRLCSYCKEQFAGPYLKKHILEQHSGKTRPTVKCKKCDKEMLSKYHLVEHLRSHDAERSKISCEICGKMFLSLRYLSRHKKVVHSGGFKMKCPKCNVTLSRKIHCRGTWLYMQKKDNHTGVKCVQRKYYLKVLW